MSELLRQLPLKEVLRPDVTPEMGFQSYEMLSGHTEQRKQQEKDFLSGGLTNPHLDYPNIEADVLHKKIQKLEGILARAHEHPDKVAAGAIWDSASYRMAEMYWLLEAKRLNEFSSNPDSNAFKLSASRYQELNEQLYGTPEKEVSQKAFGEVLAQAEAKDLHPGGVGLLNELKYGFTYDSAEGKKHIRGINELADGRLPEINRAKLAVLREVLFEDFADIKELVDAYWREVLAQRGPNKDGKIGFDVYDMQNLFLAARDMRDPENEARISVQINPESTQLAWDTPTMSVVIGGQRSVIEEKDDMFAKIVHEYGKHGLSAVLGLKSSLPVLGTGLYTAADSGERSDYLTFEEGWASLCEIAVNDSPEQWKPVHVSRYIAAVLAYEGADFRESFEINWRARVLMSLKSGEQPTEALIDKEKKQAYISTVRIRRGTPTDLQTDQVLTYNKDLAYLHGKLDALRFLDMVGDNKDLIRSCGYSKHDPFNKRQKYLADLYGVKP